MYAIRSYYVSIRKEHAMLRTSFASLLSICIVAARVSIAAGNGGAGHEYDGITVEDGKSRDFVSKQCTLTIFQSEIINRYSKT